MKRCLKRQVGPAELSLFPTVTPDRDGSGDSRQRNEVMAKALLGRTPFRRWVSDLDRALANTQVFDFDFDEMTLDEGLYALRSLTLDARARGQTAFVMGDSDTASLARQVASDLGGTNKGMTSWAPSGVPAPLASAVAVVPSLSEELEQRAEVDDMLIAVSATGTSRGLLNAADSALARQVGVITFSAGRDDSPLRRLGYLNFFVPTRVRTHALVALSALLQYWVDSTVGLPNGTRATRRRAYYSTG